MKKCHNAQPKGLILLVVLGMLALFSLLAVTYVVFASQSRASSVALARRNIRESKNKNPLFEEAIKQLIRGTTDPASAVYGHDFLGDLYGDFESLPANAPMLQIRNYQFDPQSGATSLMNYSATGGLQRPMLLGGGYSGSNYVPGKFLRIPLDPGVTYGNTSAWLPKEHDVLTGRIVTFQLGAGPLGGQSFRIIRYVGETSLVASGAPAQQIYEFSQIYSIVIDLSEAELNRTYSTRDAVTGALITSTVGDWIAQEPPVTQTSTWASGVYACYANVSLDPNTRTLAGGYNLFMNATPLNSHGVGILNNGATQMHVINTAAPQTEVNAMPVAFQTRYQNLLPAAGLGTLVPTIGTQPILGDSDEPYDAADFQNLFLAGRDPDPNSTQPIIPSFHRAALINYIVNWKDPASYTEAEFLQTLKRIELAVSRPLSINVTTPNGGQARHPTFTGSNIGLTNVGNASMSSVPSLTLNVANPWNTNWPAALPAFYQWLNFLTVGPWDVDNDGNGVKDSVWVDLGMPLQTTADGKLLKALVAYYVDDLDGRIDINAAGSAVQTNLAGVRYDSPTSTPPSGTPALPFAKGWNQYLGQGMGYGPADLSFRHLFGKASPSLGQDVAETAYFNVMASRYSRSPSLFEVTPGDSGDDAYSKLNTRERRANFQHGLLPGLPLAVFGRASLGLDRLGNPFLLNVDAAMDEVLNDPYESRLVTAPHMDRPFSLSEWERIYRTADSDRSALPSRVQELFGENETTISTSTLRNEITTISRHLRAPMFAGRSIPDPASPVGAASARSFLELVNMVRQLRGKTTMTYSNFASLFPLEFHRGQPLDINRPFGNGVDDNGDGEIDEPTELSGGQAAMYINSAGGFVAAGTTEDYFLRNSLTDAGLMGPNSGTVGRLDPQVVYTPPASATNALFLGNETRQLFARHLYCLAQLIVPEDYVFPNVDRTYFVELLAAAHPNSTSTNKAAAQAKLRELRGRILAQWAVNVVDYRDSDATMTRFPYDSDPFHAADGVTDNFTWNTNPVAAGTNPPEGGVVWGMEQPELLLTESLATHDIRVHKDANANPKRYDQYRIPEGSLFLELYCPRTTNLVGTGGGTSPQFPGVPTSLYKDSGSGDVVLDVSKLTPAYAGFERFPVWRVYLSNSINKSVSPGTPALKTPNERLLAPAPTTDTSPTRSDLTYQLPSSNVMYNASGSPSTTLAAVQNASGLKLDHTVGTEMLQDGWASASCVDPDNSRVILFALDPSGSSAFTPTRANTPGVKDPANQVFVNRSGYTQLYGNQYLVIGPRDTTYFGSKKSASSTPGSPDNAPNTNRIALTSSFSNLFNSSNALVVDRSTRTTFKDCVTMVAGANLPAVPVWNGSVTVSGKTFTTKNFIGVNVSEPLGTTNEPYYAEPTALLNAMDTSADTATGALGFGETGARADAYNDYQANTNAPAKAPFDKAVKGPLANWDLDNDGTADKLNATDPTKPDVVKPGTELDWSTAYLQRLADPDKPWDATFNPYITVDWIPIDLTVFSGEEDASDMTGNTPRFASRQKTGQIMDSTTLMFTPSGSSGQTFLSAHTDVPPQSTPVAAAGTFMKYELKGDKGSATSMRPTKLGRNAEVNDGSDGFTTLGFLNSTYVLAAESSLASVPGLPTVFIGAPGDPFKTNTAWHPDSLFWANRQFVNSMELSFVPVCSPGQLMQEFSGTNFIDTKHSLYGAAYSDESAVGVQKDPRLPSSPLSAVPASPWPLPAGQQPAKAKPNNKASYTGVLTDEKDDLGFTPFSHLLNFFGESPELANNPSGATDRFPKNTPLALMFDLVETASPWNDVVTVESPLSTQLVDVTAVAAPELAPVAASNNIMLAPLRAPYNRISRFVEPGRINLDTVSNANVFQALWSNTLTPTDIDFPPYAPGSPFGGPEDIDHNQNGIQDGGQRHAPVSSFTPWNIVRDSRRGFSPIAGYYNPGGVTSTYTFNPNYPTHFAGIFKPASEAGMVPRTRNPFTLNGTAEIAKLSALADKYGVLDIYARQAPAHVTLMRGATDTVVSAGVSSIGVSKFANSPLIVDSTATQRQAFTDRYPISRLTNLVSNRSNAFAVYVTIGLFEYDETTGAIGLEYGSDKGEMERFKAFYVIDRSVPVGYRVGEDNNIEKTILVRRYLNN